MIMLIIWSTLCTAADPGCELGDWVEVPVQNSVQCKLIADAHRKAKPTNRAACYWKTHE